MLTSLQHAICCGRSLHSGAAVNSGRVSVYRAASAITRAPVDMAANFAVLHNGESTYFILRRFRHYIPSIEWIIYLSCLKSCSAGQRHPVKLTPMQKLSQILDTVGEQIQQKLDPAACKLLYNKKQLDLSLPVRFANVPSGSTLELHSGGSLLPSFLCTEGLHRLVSEAPRRRKCMIPRSASSCVPY